MRDMTKSDAWPSVSGRAAARLRGMDWASSDLGAPESWPGALRGAVEIVLGIGFPALLWWGPRYLQFRNDAAEALVGPRDSPGAPRGPLWPEMGATVEAVARTGAPRVDRVRLAPAPGRAARDIAVSFSSPWRREAGGPGVLAVVEPARDPAPGGGGDLDAEARIQALKRQVAELQHASRNTFAVIRSIARRTGAASQSVSECIDHLDGRISALARVQAALARSPASGVNLALLIADTLMATGARERRDFTLAGPDVFLKGKRAETLGLAFHELATNAVKFGALSRREGRIAVEWRTNPKAKPLPLLEIAWVERDGSAPTIAPGHRGFGTELLDQTMAYEINAQVERHFTPTGFRCRIRLPLRDPGGGAGGSLRARRLAS